MQHGTCLSREINPEQPLSPVGREQVEKSGLALRKMGLGVDTILCSPKLRSRQTAEIVAAALGRPAHSITVTDAVKALTPASETLEYLRQFPPRSRVFVVGHMPSLGEVASVLLAGGTRLALQIENGGLTRVDLTDFERPSGTLVWHLTPQLLGLYGGHATACTGHYP